MPIARFQMPDGRIGRFEVPAGLSPEQATALIEQEVFGAKPPEPSKERTFGEAATDIYAGLKGGVGSLLQLPSQLAGVVGGYEKPGEETGLAAVGKELREEAEALKSPGLKAREAARAAKIAEAEKKGQLDAFFAAFSETVRDPGLLTNFLAEQAPQLIPALGAARLVAPLAGTSAAVRAAVGTGAVQQGADIAAGTYEQVYKELTKQGVSETEAAGQALGLARLNGVGATGLSILAQRLPGARALEEAFAGKKGELGRILGGARGALGEGVSEVVEETPARFLQNLAMAQVAPETSLTAGLGETAGMAAVGGVGLGGITGLLQRQARVEEIPKTEVPSQFAPTPEPEPEPPLLLEDKGVFRPVGLPDGTVAMTREDLERYEEEQFRKKYAPQPVEREALPEPPVPGLPTEAGLSYATATQEIEELKTRRQTPEVRERIRELQSYKADILIDQLRRAREPVRLELLELRQQMESGLMTPEGLDVVMDDALAQLQKLTQPQKQKLTKEEKEEKEEIFKQQTELKEETARLDEQRDAELAQLKKEVKAKSAEASGMKSARTEKYNLRTFLTGKLTRDDVIDINPDKKFRKYIAPKGEGLELSDMVADGRLDLWLPPDMRSESPTFDEKDSTEYIKEQLRQDEVRVYDVQNQQRLLEEEVGQITERINQLEAAKKAAKELPSMTPEERQQEAAALAAEAGFQGAPEEVANVPEEQEEYYPDKYLSIEPPTDTHRKPSFRREASRILNYFNNDRLSADVAMAQLNRAYDESKSGPEIKPRRRGGMWIRRKLLEAIDQGVLDEQAFDFVDWMIKSNPALVDDLAIAIKTEKEGNIAAGGYNPMGKMFTLFKNRASETTAVHEILHHMERMMPENVQDELRKLWAKRLIDANKKAQKSDDANLKQFFNVLTSYHFGGSQSEMQFRSALKMIADGKVAPENYQYSNPSEFWAVNATDIMSKRFGAKEGVINKLRQWLREFAQKLKSALGLSSDAPIIKALDSLIKGDGKFQSNTMLGAANAYESIPGIVKRGIEKVESMGKKPGITPDQGFAHVDPEFLEKLGPIFAPEGKTFADKMETYKDRTFQRIAQGIADQYRTIKDISPIAYMKARLSKTVDGALEGLLFNGEVKITDGALDIKPGTQGLIQTLEPIGKEVNSFLIWLALNRDASLVERGRLASINPEVVEQRNKLAAGKIGDKSRLEVYENVRKELNKLNKSVLDVALEKNQIDKKAYETFLKDVYYIPFYKMVEEEGVQDIRTASGLANQYFSKQLKGGQKPFGDLMENLLRNWNHILSASMKNDAALETMMAATKAGGAFPNLKSRFTWEDGKVYVKDKLGEAGKLLPAAELDGVKYEAGELRPGIFSSEGKKLIKVMYKGYPAYFDVEDPLLVESVLSIGYMGPKSKFLDVARDFKNMLQFGVTLSPAFKVGNLIRDSWQSAAVSELSLNLPKNVKDGIAATSKDNPDYISALAGGAIFNFGSAYEGDQAKMIKRLLKAGVKGENILDTESKIKSALERTWRAYQDLGNKSEAANRMALYKQLREKGYSHLEASFYARDLLDFSMQGSWPAFRLLTQVIPFLNARTQGLYKLGRDGIMPTSRVIYNSVTGKEIDATDKQKAQQFSIVTGATILASLMLYLAFKDDDEFKKREQWDRDNFWWFRLPGMESAVRIPKPFEIGAFGTFAERIAEQMIDEGAEGKVFEQSMKRMLTDTFAINPIPQMIKPLVDLYANKDSFTGAPIETAGMERLSKAERVATTTSPLAKLISQVTNVFLPEATEVSPVQMDYAIKAYLGWMGATISATSHYAVQPFSKSAYPDHNWQDTITLGFVKSLPAAQSGYVTSFYENMKTIEQAYSDMRHYAEMGQSEKVQEILEEKGDKIALAKLYDKVSKDMAKIRQAQRVILADETMDGAQKKEEIDRLKMLIGDLAKQAEDVRKSLRK